MSSFDSPLRIRAWPDWSSTNPYQRLFYDALESSGCEVSFDCQINDQWLQAHADSIDIVHIHWPEEIWRIRGGTRFGQLRGVLGLNSFFKLGKTLGFKFIWTVHNLKHHEGTSFVDQVGYRILARHSDLLICHSQSIKSAIDKKYRCKDKSIVMEHGNYDGKYPKAEPKENVISELGLNSELPLFVNVGRIRDYKGCELIGQAAQEMSGRAQFVVAGTIHQGFDPSELQYYSSRLDNFHLMDKFVDEQIFSNLISASDAVILPYKKITGSGVLLAAWTLGRPVIASDLNYFKEMSRPEPLACQFFRTGDSKGLQETVENFMLKDKSAVTDAVARIREYYSWDRCIKPVAAVLNQWMF